MFIMYGVSAWHVQGATVCKLNTTLSLLTLMICWKKQIHQRITPVYDNYLWYVLRSEDALSYFPCKVYKQGSDLMAMPDPGSNRPSSMETCM